MLAVIVMVRRYGTRRDAYVYSGVGHGLSITCICGGLARMGMCSRYTEADMVGE